MDERGGSHETQGVAPKETWQKPELEKFPLNDAQTGFGAGTDSEVFS